MTTEITMFIISVVALFILINSFVMFIIIGRKYYNYMKQFHRDVWWNLMSKDPFVEATGEWIRGHLGSADFFNSIFKLKETYNDNTVKKYKLRAVISFVIFIVSFIIFLVTAAILPK